MKTMFRGASFVRDAKKDKKKLSKVLLVLLLIVAMAPSYYLYNVLIQSLYNALAPLNQQGALLSLGIAAASLIILFFGFMSVFSVLFGAKDLDMLLSAPIAPGAIVSSKLAGIIITEYLFAIPILAPIYINYGINMQAGALYWVYAVIQTLLVPMIPLSIACIIATLLVRLFGMRVNVEKIQTGFMLVFVLIAVGLNLLTSKASSLAASGSEEMLMQLVSDNRFLLEYVARYFPPAGFAASALVDYNGIFGLLFLLLYAACNAAAFALAVFTGKVLYLGGVMRGLGGKVAKKVSAVQEKEYKNSSPAMSIFKNDFRILLRTPIYAFNTVFIVPLLPAVLLLSFVTGGEEVSGMVRTLYLQYPDQVMLYGCIALIFFCGIVPITSSSFSREGSAFWLNQVIPITPKDQLIGRCIGAAMIDAAMIITMLVVFGLFMQANALVFALMGLVSFICILPVIVSGLMLDLIRPYLNWTDPVKPVKQNTNVLFGMLIALSFAAVNGLVVLLLNGIGVSPYLVLAAMCVVSLTLTRILVQQFIRIFPKRIQFS
jgi:ABC-2 type transport system permease protein